MKTLHLSIGLALLIAGSGCQSKRKNYVVPLPAPRKMSAAELAANVKPAPDVPREIGRAPQPETRSDNPIPPADRIPQIGGKVAEADLSDADHKKPGGSSPDVAPPDANKNDLPKRVAFEKYWLDSDALKSDTVFFEFDRSDIRSAEAVKIEEVALFLAARTTAAVLVDGHCDERGTEEYNRALGENRALSIREHLVKLGIQPHRIYTRSFGEDLPAEFGQNESSHAKNRRGEFALLIPRN